MDSNPEEENEKRRKRNLEVLLFAIAVLFARETGVDIKGQTKYQDLTAAQKTFAKKMYEETPSMARAVRQDGQAVTQRITEEQVVAEIAKLAQAKRNLKQLRIVTVGDEKVCGRCLKWQGVVVNLGDGAPSPTLDDAIKGGFLHYGCRCSLQEIRTAEIPLNPLNPRYGERKRANPAAYNSADNGLRLAFN